MENMQIHPPPNKVDLTAPLKVGGVALRNRVVLAPMSGVSDAPFRALADRFGAGMVVSEMIASAQLAEDDPDAVLRTTPAGHGPFVIQLAGREAYWMGEAARIAEARGADIIDINMGCPARKVTGGNSGSALMRDLDHALTLIEAVVGAVQVPVTLKMRLGWDENSLNAPELAARAEAAGVKLFTVHGRTRCQFFKGQADWRRIADVKAAVSVPVIANGDIISKEDIDTALAQSGADAVMIGRGAYGAPWFPGAAAHNTIHPETPPDDLADVVEEHFESMLAHYGSFLGIRNARKHLGWYVSRFHPDGTTSRLWREALCQSDDEQRIRTAIRSCFGGNERIAA